MFPSPAWHWLPSGLAIAAVLFALLYAGKTFGFSSNLRTLCSIAGAGRYADFFRFDWRAQRWNLVFAAGAILGGFIATTVFPNPAPMNLSAATTGWLATQGIGAPAAGEYVPHELFSFADLLTPRGLVLGVVGGFLIGFGTRWAGGCTSGHAITGLSNLQLPSLIAVIGFFAGGLLMTWFILPQLLQLG